VEGKTHIILISYCFFAPHYFPLEFWHCLVIPLTFMQSGVHIVSPSYSKAVICLYTFLDFPSSNIFFVVRQNQLGPKPPHYWGFWITQLDAHLVGLLWVSGQLIAETATYTAYYTPKTNIHAFGRVQTYDPSSQVASDLCLRYVVRITCFLWKEKRSKYCSVVLM
jgi:hypothetical protein